MTRAAGFWGLVVEPSKLYSQQVPASFKVTMASLGSNKELEATANGKSQRTSLIFNLDNKEDFTLCSLVNEKLEQQALDLVMTEGETIAFRVEGPNAIHLSGYYINDEEDEDDGFINDEDEDEVYSDEAEEDSQIEYDSELEDEETDDSEEETKSNNPRIRVLESDDEEEEEEEDSEEDSEFDSEEEEDSDEEMDSEEESEEDSEEEIPAAKDASRKVKFDLPEAKKVKESPKPAAPTKVSPPPAKAAPAPAAPAAKPASPQAKEQGPTPVKKTLPSGLQIEDLKLGNGAKVSNGKTVLIHYKGTLLNGSVFDSSFGGKPLKFVAGKGQVIKGMDMGIIGMAVGGSRKLVIPGPLAYGNQNLPKIPRNSTLVFEIRLERIL